MATLRSLGVHSPSALPFLVSEGILSEDANHEQYHWETYVDNDADVSCEEELLWTQYHVVWSRGGVVHKFFNFEVEEQGIVQVVMATFATGRADISSASKNSSEELAIAGPVKASRFGQSSRQEPLELHGWQPISALDAEPKRSRAIVVFLKQQAHIFFIKGTTHIVNLPFEVGRAFATCRGLIIQRRLTQPNAIPSSPILPAPPPNSFLSSQTFSQPSFLGHAPFPAVKKNKPLKGSLNATRTIGDILREASMPSDVDMPPIFSFTDPLSDFGLVIDTSDNSTFNASQSSFSGRRAEPISQDEEIVYVSPTSELPCQDDSKDRPLIIMVTVNYSNRTYSIWNMVYTSARPPHTKQKPLASTLSVKKSRRRSSYGPTVPGTGATTPGPRSRDPRESLVPQSQIQSRGVSSRHASQATNTKKTAEDMLASQVDPDYTSPQKPPRESRRVSSLLSRADLSTSFDKNAFQDRATHRTSLGASFGSQARRNLSFGYPERMSFGARRERASTPGSISRQSFGELSIDDTIEDIMDESMNDYSSDEPDGVASPEHLRGLKREVMASKISEFPFDSHAPIFRTSFSTSNSPKVHILKPMFSMSC
jgi:anaphase-promoting complex subunit 1